MSCQISNAEIHFIQLKRNFTLFYLFLSPKVLKMTTAHSLLLQCKTAYTSNNVSHLLLFLLVLPTNADNFGSTGDVGSELVGCVDIGSMLCRHRTSRMDYASFYLITVFGACLGLNVPRKLSMLSFQKSNVCFLLDSLKIKVYHLTMSKCHLKLAV